MSGNSEADIKSSLAAFRESEGLGADPDYDALVIKALLSIKPETLTAYFKQAKSIATEIPAENTAYQHTRFFRRVFRRLLLNKGRFSSAHSKALLDNFAATSEGTNTAIEKHGHEFRFLSPDALRYDQIGANVVDDTSDGKTGKKLKPAPTSDATRKKIHEEMRKTLHEIDQAVIEEVTNTAQGTEGYYIGYRHGKGLPSTNAAKVRAAILQDKVTVSPPPPPPINPANVIVSVNSLIDNALPTSGDRILKALGLLTTPVGAQLHGAFSWLGLGVSIVYTAGFALNLLYRKFCLKENLIFGFRDAMRLIFSLSFLTLVIIGVSGIGTMGMFVLGFPLIAGCMTFFALGEHVYDCLHKNKKDLEEIPKQKEPLKKQIDATKRRLFDLEKELADIHQQPEPACKQTIKRLRNDISLVHTLYKSQVSELTNLLKTERSLEESQIRLKDPLTVFLTVSRTAVAVLNIIGAIVFFANPIAGLSILAVAGVLILVNCALGIYNKERLDRIIEGRNGAPPAVPELSVDLNVPTHALIVRKLPAPCDKGEVSASKDGEPAARITQINKSGADLLARSSAPYTNDSSSDEADVALDVPLLSPRNQ